MPAVRAQVGIAGRDVGHQARRCRCAHPREGLARRPVAGRASGSSQRLRHALHVLVAAPREVDQDDRAVGGTSRASRMRVGDRVRRLERRQDAFEPRQRLEALERLGVGDVRVLGAARGRAATRARGRRRRSRARPRSSASARCCPPRPAARTCACPAARRCCRRRSAPRAAPARSARRRPRRRSAARSRSSTKPSKMPIALLPPPTQATTTSGSRPACSSICRRASRPITDWNSRTISGYGCGPSAEPSR